MLTINRTSAPATEPLLLSEVKTHLRVDGTDEDALIVSLIAAAREYVESFTRRALITQTWTRRLGDFANTIDLPRPPLQSVSSITYTDLQGDSQTVTASVYDVDTDSEPGAVTLGYQQVWPSVRNERLPVTITYVAGYGTASDVPQAIKQAIMMLVAHWYEHRQFAGDEMAELPMAVHSLLWPYRILTL